MTNIGVRVMMAVAALVSAALPAKAALVDDRSEIEKATNAIVSGFVERNMDKIMSGYAPGEDLVVFDSTPPMMYIGADALRKLNQRWMDTFPGKAEGSYRDFHVTIVGKVAYGYNVQDWKFTWPDGKIFKFSERLTDVYRKIDGKWRVVQEHGSFPVDLKTGMADFEAKNQ
jgi:ketosteroid isomerase-like protein